MRWTARNSFGKFRARSNPLPPLGVYCRLKKVQEKKKGRKEAQELLDAANAESLRAKMEKLGTQHGAAVTDMLGQAEDPDVIF